MLAQTIAEVRAGRTNPRIGTALAYMTSSLLKAIEIDELESRLKRLENKNELALLGMSAYETEH